MGLGATGVEEQGVAGLDGLVEVDGTEDADATEGVGEAEGQEPGEDAGSQEPGTEGDDAGDGQDQPEGNQSAGDGSEDAPLPPQFEKAFAKRLDQATRKLQDQFEQQYAPYRETYERLRAMGVSPEQLQQAFEQQRRQQIVAELTQAGMDPQAAERYATQQLRSEQAQAESEDRAAMQAFDAEEDRLRKVYPDYDKYAEKVYEIIQDGRAADPEAAYKIASYEGRQASARQSGEQAAIRGIQKGRKAAVESGGAPGKAPGKIDISRLTPEQIDELGDRVLRGENITL